MELHCCRAAVIGSVSRWSELIASLSPLSLMLPLPAAATRGLRPSRRCDRLSADRLERQQPANPLYCTALECTRMLRHHRASACSLLAHSPAVDTQRSLPIDALDPLTAAAPLAQPPLGSILRQAQSSNKFAPLRHRSYRTPAMSLESSAPVAPLQFEVWHEIKVKADPDSWSVHLSQSRMRMTGVQWQG